LNVNNKKINSRSRRKEINEVDEDGQKTSKRVKVEKKSIMEMELEKDDIFKSLNARKSGREDWYRYDIEKDSKPVDK
jgi:hypothetical protein